MKVVIVGGGISGIATAYLLNREGLFDVTLIEKEEIAGKAKTIYKNGYRIETGPNGFLSNKKEILDLVELSGFERELIESKEESNRKFIFSKNTLWEVPKNPAKILFSKFLSRKGRLRIFKEPFVKPIFEDETVASFVRRRLGQEFLDKVVGPMVCGIFAGDPEIMSMESNFPRIKEIERIYGSLVRGLVKLMTIKKTKTEAVSGGFSSSLMSFKDGIESFVKHLSNGIPIVKDEVVSIEKNGDGWLLIGRLRSYETHLVVFSIPAYSLSKVIFSLDRSLAESLKSIPYAPMAVVGLGFEKRRLPGVVDSFGYLFALSEIKDTIGVLFDSSVFDNRADPSKVLVRMMIGGQLAQSAAFKKNLIELSVAELQRSARIFYPFEFSFIKRHPMAIPIYTLKHKEILEHIDEFEKKFRGIFVTGNAFRGISLNDCVKGAFEVVEKIKGGL